jgi:hypothetical protein
MDTKPTNKKSRQSETAQKRTNERARRYRAALKALQEQHHTYALDLASRAALAADLLLDHPDADVRLTAIGRACRAALALIEIQTMTALVKRLEALEKRQSG